MVRKVLYVSVIICLFMFNITYATDIVMDLNSNTNSINTSNETVDNTLSQVDDYLSGEYDDVSSTTTEYEDPGELSITNMINIILIVVGVVLVLLGIAIIIKLK